MKKLCSAVLLMAVIIFAQPVIAQQVNDQTSNKKVKIDSLLDTYSIEEIIKFRDYYQQQIELVEKEKIALRERGIADAEKFVKENLDSKVLDRVLMRLAELYYEESNETFLKQMQEYDQLLEQSDSTQVDTVLREPKRDFSKPLAIYDRIIKEMPYSNLVDDAYYNKGYILEEIGEADSALQVYNYIINELKESRYAPESLMRIAEYYFNPPHNQVDTAITYYKKILEYKDSPKFNEALYRLGWSYYRLSNYTEAVSYFTFLVDDIQRAKSLDPDQKFTNPALRDEALEYIGISFFDHGGITAAVNYLVNLNTPDYGFDILKKLGDVYMEEKEHYEEAVKAYSTLLKMYPDNVQAPQIHEKIVRCFRLQNDDRLAYLQRDRLFNLYKPGSPWWKKHNDEKIRETVSQICERSIRDNVNLLFQQADFYKDEDLYRLAVVDCKKYLKTFPTDSSAARIHWNMALTMDTRLKQYDQAFEEYMKLSDLYWNSKYQRFAAENAIALAKDAVEEDSSKKDILDEYNRASGLRENEKNVLSAFTFNRINLSNSERKLIRAYNNYIKLYPHEPETVKILTNAGALYFNNNIFPEALKYLNTAVKHFPDHENINTVKYQILECYFGKGDYKSSEIVARKLKNSPDVEAELIEKTKRRLAEAIFLSAKVYADSADHLQAGNEYLRVVKEVPDVEFAALSIFNAAWEYDKAKEYSRAVETYNFLIETRPQSKFKFEAMNNLAIDYGELEEYKSAALTYERLSAKTGEAKQAHDALYNSSLFFVKGEYWEDAIRINQAFVEKFPASEDADDMFFDIATYYLRLDKFEKANQFYADYVAKFPNSPRVVESFFNRGKYFEEKGDLENAKAEYQKAVEKNDEFHRDNLKTNDYFAAEALSQVSKMKFEEFREIDFLLPAARMEETKQKKRDLLIDIVDGFTKVASYSTVRLYEATYNIGRAYEEFADSWARQEMPAMDRTQRIITRKEINAATVELYGKAEDSYKQSITILKKLADEYEKSLIVSDSSGISDRELKKIVARDSTLYIARTWIDRCEEKLSRVIYDMAELNLTTVKSFLNAPIPQGLSSVAQLEYVKQILIRAVTPLIIDIIDEHIRNVHEAWKLGLENQWVKLSRKKAITTNKLLAEQYDDLAHKALDFYAQNIETYCQLVDSGSASTADERISLSDQLATLIDYNKEFVSTTTEIYKQTLNIAEQEKIQDPSVSQIRESLFRDLYQSIQRAKKLAQTAYSNRIVYDRLFKDSNKIVYEDALFSFEDNYFSIKENSQELLEEGYRISQEKQIDNRWAKRTLLALVEENPQAYSYLLDLKMANKIILSDLSWHVSDKYNKGWINFDFNDVLWKTPEYVDINDQLAEKELLPVWMKINDTTGFIYDTTYVVETDTNNFLFDSDSLLTDSVANDSVQLDSSAIVEQKKRKKITPHPEIERLMCDRVYFRKYFDIAGLPVSAVIRLKVDDSYNLFVNGEYIASYTSTGVNDTTEHLHRLTDILVQKKNVIAIEVFDSDKSGGGLIARLNVIYLPDWEEKKQQILFETSDKKIKENLAMDKYIIMY